MEFIIKLAVLILGAHLLEDPEPCNCARVEHSYKMTTEPIIVHVHDFNRKRCLLSLNAELSFAPTDGSVNFEELTISVHSSSRGLLSRQSVAGARAYTIHDQMILQKKERIWIKVASNGKHEYLVNATLTE